MKKILLALMVLVMCVSAQAQYTFQKTDCRMEVIQNGSIKYSFLLDELRWTTRIHNSIYLFDDVATFTAYTVDIDNYVADQRDSLILDMTSWKIACRDTATAITPVDLLWENGVYGGITPKNDKPLEFDSTGATGTTVMYQADSAFMAYVNAFIMVDTLNADSIVRIFSLGAEGAKDFGVLDGIGLQKPSTGEFWVFGIDNDTYSPKMGYINFSTQERIESSTSSSGFSLVASQGFTPNYNKRIDISGSVDDLVLSATDYETASVTNMSSSGITHTVTDTTNMDTMKVEVLPIGVLVEAEDVTGNYTQGAFTTGFIRLQVNDTVFTDPETDVLINTDRIELARTNKTDASRLVIDEDAFEFSNAMSGSPTFRITHDAPTADMQILTYDSADSTAKWTSHYGVDSIAQADSSLVVWDLEGTLVQEVTLTANATLQNPTNPVDGKPMELIVIQDGTGSWTLSYASKYKFPGGTVPTITTTAGAKDILTCVYHERLDLMYCTITQDFQ